MHLVTIVLALLSAGARADLPIHCLRKWIHGDWVMRRSAMRSGGVAQCGYVAPDNNAQHFSQNHKFHYESSGEEMHLSLRSPNLVECTKGCEKGKHLGNFTMTYDEGMEIQMPDMVFYAFFKYTPKSNVDPEVTDSLKHYDSDCSKTRTGWIHEQAVKPDKWGCASMEQIRGVSPQEKCVTVQDTLTADQPALLNGEIDVAGNYSTTSEPRFRGKVSSRTSKACLGAAAALVEKAGAGVQQTAILEKWIEKHNSDPEALWTATAYDKFEGMQLKEAMNRLGSQRAKVIPHRHHHHGKAASSSSSLSSTTTDSSSTSSIVDLPKSFDWRQKGIETAVQDQGNCGSCYAQAALDVAAMRYRIQKPNMEPLTFSVDDHIDTSFYNQGCSGGYPYLVGKHGKDLGFRTVKCYQENKNCDERHFIKGYGYVGGYYGGGNMESIMREIHDKGPVIAAFEPSGTFFSYKSGIFTGAKGPHTDDWEKTDHAIVLIGWGETTDGVKYWIGKK